MTVLEGIFPCLRERKTDTSDFSDIHVSAVCGSCATFINGRQRLACNAQIVNVKATGLQSGPLPHLPIISDLVVDLHPFFQRMEMVKPYFEGHEPSPERESSSHRNKGERLT